MKNMKIFAPLFALSLLLTLFSCNPECTSIEGLRVIPADGNPPGYEVTIQANDLNALRENTKVFFNGNAGVNPRFQEGYGLIVGVPQGAIGVSDLRIVDLDCEHVISGFDIMNEFPAFNAPAPPQIVIPLPPPIFPADISKAWISPQDGDYCLWLGGYQEYFLPDTMIWTNMLNGNSWELSASRSNVWYDFNPVAGLVDTVNNEIHLTIDRTAKGLGTESYVGEFVDISRIDPESANAGKQHMIFLTSEKTGRQLLVFKN